MPDTPSSHDLGAQFTEIFIKKSDNVGLILSLMEVINLHNNLLPTEIRFLTNLFSGLFVH